MGVPVFTFDARGKVVYANRAAEHVFRASVGSSVRDLVAGPGEADQLLGISARLRPGTSVVMSVNFLVDSTETVAARVVCSFLDDDPRATTCVIVDPVAGDSLAVASPASRAANVLRLRGAETILVAEDEPTVRSLVRRVLERKGYRVITAQDAPSALEIAAAHNGTLDLLLTDMVMPGMSGRELAALLIARFPRLCVLYMSGYSVEAIASNGMVDPGTHFLEKPFTTRALVDKVREAIDSRPLIPEA